jgi:hypothetical protein
VVPVSVASTAHEKEETVSGLGKFAKATVTGAFVIGATVCTLASPASAADQTQCVYINVFCAASGKVYNLSTWVQSCDVRSDGLGARTWYTTYNGALDYVGDGDGSGGSCGNERAVGGSSVESFQVCVGPLSDEICSPWKRGY